jgi:hypothetical protein
MLQVSQCGHKLRVETETHSLKFGFQSFFMVMTLSTSREVAGSSPDEVIASLYGNSFTLLFTIFTHRLSITWYSNIFGGTQSKRNDIWGYVNKKRLNTISASDTHFRYRLNKPKDLVRPEGLGNLKKLPHRDTNPQPCGLYHSALTTTLPRARSLTFWRLNVF